MKKYFILYLLMVTGLLVQHTAQAQQTPARFAYETQYLVYLPDGYALDTAKQWPLLLFLHGSGESGTDLELVKKNGLPKLVAAGKKFPFIIISPQAPDAGTGWEPWVLFHFLEGVKLKYRVDKDRIYLTGLSMGGFGTWALAIKHPEQFAAIVPICGGGDNPGETWKLRHIPVWCFHGAKDNNVPIALEAKMIDSLKVYNNNVRFTIYPETGHDSWVQAYDTDSLYTWLLSKKRFLYKEIAVSAQVLHGYAGRYTQGDKDTVEIGANALGLFARVGKDTIPVKPADTDLFFIKEDQPVDIRFVKNSDGFVEKFVVYDNNITAYYKIPEAINKNRKKEK